MRLTTSFVPLVQLSALLTLSAVASYLSAGGLKALWTPRTHSSFEDVATFVCAAALHAAWIIPASTQQRLVLIVFGWTVSLALSRDGLVAAGVRQGEWANAFLLEFIILSLAAAHAPVISWPDRLAGWRRSRERITTELRIGQGLLPWIRNAAHRLLLGQADRPLLASFDRIVAELADHEGRMRHTIASLSVPEAVREALQNAAQAIVADAEVTTAQMAMELERRALDRAANCRDAILTLKDLPDIERDQLARECESLMLDLAQSVGQGARR